MLLRVQGLGKRYGNGTRTVSALQDIDLCIDHGEFVSIMGPSGSGKSTLLHLIGGLERPSSGSISIAGSRIDEFSDSALSAFRRRKLGFVFQAFNLIPTLTAEENAVLPLLLDGATASAALPKARALLTRLGVGHRLEHRPDQLSGGEVQRVAIARALIADPLLILADEPTGNLDTKTGQSVLTLLSQLVHDHGPTIVMVTHDTYAAAIGSRTVLLRDGQIESDGMSERSMRAG